MRLSVSLCAVALVLATGCNRFEYSHGFPTVALRPAATAVSQPIATEGGGGADHIQLEHRMSLQTNEIVLADDTGVSCAAIATASEQASAEQAAVDAAVASGQTSGYVEYWYRVYSPAEFAGVLCGAYYRGSSGEGTVQGTSVSNEGVTSVAEYDAEMTGYELGMYLGGADSLAGLSWLRWSLEFRLGFGNFDVKAEETTGVAPNVPTGDTYITMPLRLGLMFFPEFLFGLGIVADAGADPLAWAFSDSGGVIDKIDYSARAEWDFGTPALGIGVFGGWQARHVGWGDMWVKRSGLFMGATLSLHFDTLFG